MPKLTNVGVYIETIQLLYNTNTECTDYKELNLLGIELVLLDYGHVNIVSSP